MIVNVYWHIAQKLSNRSLSYSKHLIQMEFAFFTAGASKIRFYRVTAFITSLIIVSSSFIETDADLNLAIRFALAIRFNILSDIFAFYSGLQHRISRNTSILRKSGNSISYKFFSSSSTRRRGISVWNDTFWAYNSCS